MNRPRRISRARVVEMVSRHGRARVHADRMTAALEEAQRAVLRLESLQGEAEELAANTLADAHEALAQYGAVVLDGLQWSARTTPEGDPDIAARPLGDYGMIKIPTPEFAR